MPKEYPELCEAGQVTPDSSNRLTSPAPSSEAPSPVSRVTRTCVEVSTQTEARVTSSIGVQVETSTEVKTEAAPVIEKRRGCPPGGWPGRKKKKLALDYIQAKIKTLLEKPNRESKYQCEFCSKTFSKIFKLKMHLINSHINDITAKLSNEAEAKPFASEPLPERKSSRIEQKDDVKKELNSYELFPKPLKEETGVPLHLQRSESESWTEGCEFFCMLCSESFTNFAIYKHHIGDNHGLLIEDYRAKFGKVGESIKKYQCKVCDQEMIHKNSTIKAHMKTSHNLSLADYYTSHVKESEPDSLKSTSENENIVPTSEEPNDQSTILNQLEYEDQCTLDDYSSKSESKKTCENGSQISDNEQNDTPDTQWFVGGPSQQYQCLICNANIAHKHSNISSHLNLIHDLSIQEYEAQYLNISHEEAEEFIIESQPETTEAEEQEYEFTEADIIIEEPEVAGDSEGISVDSGALDSEHAWYHGSNLTCQICSKTFANDQWYFHHFSKIHGMTKEQYNEQYGKDMEHWNQYQCLICNSEIRWKYSSIRQHLKQVHSMTIQDYEARYMDAEAEAEALDNVEAVTNICSEVSPSSTPVIKAKALPPPPPLKASPFAMAARKNSDVSNHAELTVSITNPVPQMGQLSQKGSITFDNRPRSQWYHGSDLCCEICQKQFVDFTYYCTHIRTVHQISKEQYNERYGTANEKFRLYRCLVCGISIKWTYQSICGHLKSHEMTIKDYENKYDVLEGQNTDSGKISDLTMNANAGGHVLEFDDGQRDAKRPKFGDSLPPLMQAHHSIERRMMGMNKPERISADVSSPTGKWYNQCKFTCKACPEEKYFTVPQALRMHLNGIHGLSRKAYEVMYGPAETVTRYWTCLICNKELKCQKGIIIQHLLNVHSMELVDYERQYMDAGDQVVARENRKPRKRRMMNMMKGSGDSYEAGPSDLTHFLVQRMDEGMDNVSLDGPAITEEVNSDEKETSMDGNNVTSLSTLTVEGMEHVPWYFGCRYSCQICNKVWHYPQAARYHLDSVHKLTRAAYEAQFGTCEVETRIFHCSLCQRTMKCERDIIKYHLEAKHSMSLEDYIDQFPNPVVTVGESRRSNAANHARTANNPLLANLQRLGGPGVSEAGNEAGNSNTPWYRGSNFTCIPCQRNFTAQVSYISHINTKHGLNLKEYREQYGNAEQIKQYDCKVPGCTRYVAWTYSGINDHLKSHNLSMQQYEQQYLGIGVPPSPVEISSPRKVTVAAAESINEPEDFSSVVESWANGGSRECQLCKKSVSGSEQFSDHLLQRHQITETEYSLQHDNMHTCQLCGDKIEHKAESIKSHMLEKHSITIEHYYHKFIRSTNQDATNAEIITALKPGISEPRPQIQITSISSVSLPSTNSIKVRKNHWANGCVYQCVLCKGQKYPEEFMFKKHIMTAHNMAPEEYQNNFGDPALVKQLHICKVMRFLVKFNISIVTLPSRFVTKM